MAAAPESDDAADLRALSEADLVARLAVSGLAPAPALRDEILARGTRAIASLARVVRHAASWQAGGDRYWAPVHATLLLGALAARHPTDTALDALCAAIDHHAAHPSPEFAQAFPQLLGAIGPPVLPRLRDLVEDGEADPDARWTALWALASAAARGHQDVAELRALLRDRLADDYEEGIIREAAARHLLDMAEPDDREQLLAWIDEAAGDEDSLIGPPITAAEVETACAGTPPQRGANLLDDWRDFYAPARLELRRRRTDEASEGEAWLAGLRRGDPETIKRLGELLTAHLEARKAELADPEVRERAAETAAKMALWATTQGAPPTSWDGERFRIFLLQELAMMPEAEDPEWLADALDQTLPFLRYLEGAGFVTPADRAACEAVFAAERAGMIETAEVLARGDAGTDQTDPDAALAARIGAEDDPLGLYADEEAEEGEAAGAPFVPPDSWAPEDEAEPEVDEPWQQETKPGRNDPCPCGSGRKYKRCCAK